MVDTTTRLNTPGPRLAALAGVHSITDVTGFGLAGHALEMARGAGCRVVLEWARVPLLPGVQDLASQGLVTGASGRNWAAYGVDVSLDPALDLTDRALLTDPQTSGGLLVACAPEAVAEVLAIFEDEGFAEAADIGGVEAAESPGLEVRAGR
jgi:selenide,water dikinase